MSTLVAAEGEAIRAVFHTFENTALWVIVVIALAALAFAAVLRRQVLSAPEGTDKMKEISRAVQEGSAAYLNRQFRTVGVFVAVLAVAIFFVLPVPSPSFHSDIVIRFGRSIAFIVGAVFSATVGFSGMWLAVRANVRVAAAARDAGLRRAMTLAFRTGGVAGMFTVGLGLLGATLFVIIYKQDAPKVLVGLAFGAALLAMFMRVGGGIFTKAADVGADLVGKVEQGIPEDDPRNAAVIADNVGDNVGDCAGMAADLFESYEVTLAASIILGAGAYAGSTRGAVFPLLVMGIGVIVAVIGILSVAPRSETEPGMRAINRGFFLSALLAAVGVLLLSVTYLKSVKPFIAVLIGLALASVIQVLTEHYTSTRRRPGAGDRGGLDHGPGHEHPCRVRRGLESSVWSLLVVAAAIAGCFYLGSTLQQQLFYVSLAGMGLLSAVGVIVSMDTFGPISDNAQGIAEMSGEFEGRRRRDPRRPGRRRQLHEGHHEGHGDRDRGHRGDVAVRGVPGRRSAVGDRGERPDRAGRAAARRLGGVPVLVARDPRGGPRRRAGRGGGPQPVPRPPGDHGLHREAGLRRGGRHLHEDVAARARSRRACWPSSRRSSSGSC